MRTLFLLLLPLASACAQQSVPAPAPPAGGTCNAGPAQFAVGQPYSQGLGEQARQRSGARVLRLLRAGDAATMEFSPERLTIQLDEAQRVATARCG